MNILKGRQLESIFKPCFNEKRSRAMVDVNLVKMASCQVDGGFQMVLSAPQHAKKLTMRECIDHKQAMPIYHN